jgi:hypothetical protein
MVDRIIRRIENHFQKFFPPSISPLEHMSSEIPSQNNLNSYLNCLLQLHQQSQLVVPAPPNPAEKLRSLLGPSPAPVAPIQARKKIYQTFRPPLVITNEKKLGDADGPIMYTEVTDPDCPSEKYILCGECDSVRLFRNLGSLFKHRRSCSQKEQDHPPVSALIEQAKNFLQSLSPDALVDEANRLGVVECFESNEQLIISILAVVTGESVPQVALNTPVDYAETQPIDIPADVPPLQEAGSGASSEETADIPPIPEHLVDPIQDLLEKYTSQSERIRDMFPGISPEYMILALVSGILPVVGDGEEESDNSNYPKKVGRPKKSGKSIAKQIQKDVSVKTPSIPDKLPKPRARKSRRLAKINRDWLGTTN